MNNMQKALITGGFLGLILTVNLIYYSCTNKKFYNFLENYNLPENHIPSEALGIYVIKN